MKYDFNNKPLNCRYNNMRKKLIPKMLKARWNEKKKKVAFSRTEAYTLFIGNEEIK